MSRPALRVIDAVQSHEGGGFPIRRPFPTSLLPMVDPFLLLDEMGPVTWPPGEAIGAPDHPHRGFETVTYLIAGHMEHHDSRGNRGRLDPGDVQWMTAGRGVVHSELPTPEFTRSGGLMHGFQLWVNLPRGDKMMEPRYQEIPAAAIPEARSPDGHVHVRVIAGEALGAVAMIETRTPIMYLHVRMDPYSSFDSPTPEGYSVFAYIFRGSGEFTEAAPASESTAEDPSSKPRATTPGADLGPLVAREAQLVSFADPGENGGRRSPSLHAGADGMEVLLIGGVPLREPVVRNGPFVMNTDEEIRQAFRDYQSGHLG